jgi:hypothetical protein
MMRVRQTLLLLATLTVAVGMVSVVVGCQSEGGTNSPGGSDGSGGNAGPSGTDGPDTLKGTVGISCSADLAGTLCSAAARRAPQKVTRTFRAAPATTLLLAALTPTTS